MLDKYIMVGIPEVIIQPLMERYPNMPISDVLSMLAYAEYGKTEHFDNQAKESFNSDQKQLAL